MLEPDTKISATMETADMAVDTEAMVATVDMAVDTVAMAATADMAVDTEAMVATADMAVKTTNTGDLKKTSCRIFIKNLLSTKR